MAGVYLIDPDNKSGMLDDGTEFVFEIDPPGKNREVEHCFDGSIIEHQCDNCVGQGNIPVCENLPKCWNFGTKQNGVFKKE